MTREEAKRKLLEVLASDDPEKNHKDADDVLCALLVSLGYVDVVELYERLEKWYG